jgi:hypothetical protein
MIGQLRPSRRQRPSPAISPTTRVPGLRRRRRRRPSSPLCRPATPHPDARTRPPRAATPHPDARTRPPRAATPHPDARTPISSGRGTSLSLSTSTSPTWGNASNAPNERTNVGRSPASQAQVTPVSSGALGGPSFRGEERPVVAIVGRVGMSTYGERIRALAIGVLVGTGLCVGPFAVSAAASAPVISGLRLRLRRWNQAARRP